MYKQVLFSWCLVVVERIFLAVPWGCLRFVIVVFPDHTLLLFFIVCSFYDVVYLLSHDVASGSDITSCNTIDKALVLYKLVTLRNDIHYDVA